MSLGLFKKFVEFLCFLSFYLSRSGSTELEEGIFNLKKGAINNAE